ncbi:vesicle coat component [Basidiobolus ranarum]|uniref:Vesicle coat component n=1 Tax=Basidiobolus ranarum TaxID=34480 RepID=A0ABR2WAI5_9FUNG
MLLRIFSFFALLCGITQALKFDLQAYPTSYNVKKCISQWVPRDTLVMVTIKAGQGYNQRIDVEISDDSPASNIYLNKGDITEKKVALTTQAHADVKVCFTNTLAEGFQVDSQYKRTIEFHFDVGAEAVDYSAVAKAEKLKPMEVELYKLEKLLTEVVEEMEYLRHREARRRDTNESTNERVKWFSIFSMVVLVSLGIWQIFYLKRFFQTKKLI